MGTMNAHQARLTRTNSGGYVPVCSCGWSGTVHCADVGALPGDDGRRALYDPARKAAHDEYDRHRAGAVTAARALVPARHLAVVDRPGRYSHE